MAELALGTGTDSESGGGEVNRLARGDGWTCMEKGEGKTEIGGFELSEVGSFGSRRRESRGEVAGEAGEVEVGRSGGGGGYEDCGSHV